MAPTSKNKSNQAALDAPQPEETKVFLSYSRKDALTLHRIANALITHPEFQPDFDKAEHDPDKVGAGISADEPWWQRLEQMIAGAEAMVFLVSPHSAASKICDEEIAYAQRVGKRIIPVLAGAVDFAKLPPKLNSLNIAIDFTESGPGFDAALAHLIRVLSINAAWLREGRRYTERAADWDRKGRPKGGLLPKGAFEEAEAWASRRPKNEPEPGELFSAWIAASRANIQEQLERERRQIRRARIWQGAAALILVLGFTGLTVGTWFVAQGQRAVGLSNSMVLTRASLEADARGPDERRLLRDGGVRAVKLALAAYSDSALAPVAASSDFRLGSAIARLQAPVVLQTGAVQRVNATASADGKVVLARTDDQSLIAWHVNEDGVWLKAALGVLGSRSDFASLSPDGYTVVAASGVDHAQLWRRDSASVWRQFTLKAAGGPAVSASFSSDGQALLTISTDGAAFLSTATHSNEWVTERIGASAGPLKSAELIAGGAGVLTLSATNVVQIWRPLKLGRWTDEVEIASTEAIIAATASSDGRLIATATEGGPLQIWKREEDGGWVPQVLSEKVAVLKTARFFDNFPGLLIEASSGVFDIWHSDGADVWQPETLEIPANKLTALAFSPDGQVAAYGTWDEFLLEGHLVILQRREDGSWLRQERNDKVEMLTAISFSNDGSQILLGTETGEIRVLQKQRTWLTELSGELSWAPTTLEGHQGSVTSASFTDGDQAIITASRDGTVRIWNADDLGSANEVPLEVGLPGAGLISRSYDGSRLATSHSDSTIRVWSLGGGAAQNIATFREGDRNVSSLSLSADGRSLLVAIDGEPARLLKENSSGEWSRSLVATPGAAAGSMTLSPDANQIVMTNGDGTVQLSGRLADGTWNTVKLAAYEGWIQSTALAANGQGLFLALDDNTAKIWKKSSDGEWHESTLQGHDGPIVSGSLGPDSTTAVTASLDHTVRVWREVSEKQWQSEVLTGHTDGVLFADFTPDGSRILTASYDGSARIWSRTYDGEWISTSFSVVGDPPDFAALSADGTSFVVRDGSANLHVWRTDWLVDDPLRAELNISSTASHWLSLKEAACQKLASSSAEQIVEGGGAGTVLSPLYFYRTLSEDDLRAAPLLRARGFQVGDDLCNITRPKGLDATLTRWLPRQWWSGLNWKSSVN